MLILLNCQNNYRRWKLLFSWLYANYLFFRSLFLCSPFENTVAFLFRWLWSIWNWIHVSAFGTFGGHVWSSKYYLISKRSIYRSGYSHNNKSIEHPVCEGMRQLMNTESLTITRFTDICFYWLLFLTSSMWNIESTIGKWVSNQWRQRSLVPIVI